MKELTLQELKEIELNILKEFAAFCKDNNIRYYLAFGTLLGAIRYKKFIPWDDDVDVLVPRDDYDRLLKLFHDTDRYQLFAFEKNTDFPFPFAKLCDMTTRKEETVYQNKITLGVDIDIFPLDHFDDDFEQAKAETKYISKNMIWLGRTKLKKQITNHPIKSLVWWIIMLFVNIMGSQYFIKKIIKKSNQMSQKESRYVGAKVWCIWGEHSIIPADAFKETIEIEFEGEVFSAPSGWDMYLTCLYGDYMPEPPIEKQKTHHDFKAYRL